MSYENLPCTPTSTVQQLARSVGTDIQTNRQTEILLLYIRIKITLPLDFVVVVVVVPQPVVWQLQMVLRGRKVHSRVLQLL